MYRYDKYDQTLVDERVAAVPRPGRAPRRRRAHRRRVQAAAADERALSAAARLHAAHRRALRHAVDAAAAQAGARSRAATTRATATSRRARTCSSTGSSSRTRRTSWPSWPTSRCMPSRPAATASATSPPTTSPASPATRSRIPRIYCEIIRQWSTFHPEFSFLPRKFKIAVTGAPHDRAAVKVHDIGLRMHRNEAGEIGFEVLVGGGLGRTPVIAKTIRRVPAEAAPALLSRSDPARLQPARPARQHLQGAHQDPGRQRRRRRVRAAGRGGVAADPATATLELPDAEIERIRGYFAPPPYRDARRPCRRSTRARCDAISASPAGCAPT